MDLSVLREAPLRRLLAAQLASLSGDFAMMAALPFIVYSLGGDSTRVGVAFATGVASLLVFVLLGGVLADRHGRGRALIAGEAMRMLTQGLLAVALLAGAARYWQVLAAQVSIGAGAALTLPALTGLVAELVAPGRRQGANALRGMVGSVAMLGGPALAGAMIVLAGTGAAVALDAASYALSALLLAGVPAIRGTAGKAGAHGTSFLAELRAGWSGFSRRAWLWVMVLAFAAVNMAVLGPFEVLGAETAHASLGGAGAWSAMLAALGLGSVAGALLASAWAPRHPLRATACLLLAWAPLLVAVAVVAPLGVILAAAACTGAGWLLLAAIWESTLQSRVPQAQISRIASYDWLGSNALLPLGLFLAAPLGAALGSGTALLLSALVVVLITASVLLVPEIREMPRVDPRPPIRLQQGCFRPERPAKSWSADPDSNPTTSRL